MQECGSDQPPPLPGEYQAVDFGPERRHEMAAQVLRRKGQQVDDDEAVRQAPQRMAEISQGLLLRFTPAGRRSNGA